jgi:single-strand DNA-binding protein
VEAVVNGPQITVVGHLARPPRLRTLAGGTVVADFRIGTTPSRLDKATGEWIDLETLWFGVTCWRSLAEHSALSLNKGDRVVVTGRLSAKSWKTEQGEQRNGLEIDATSVGMDLTRGPVTQLRVQRSVAQPTAADPWVATGDSVDPMTGELTAGDQQEPAEPDDGAGELSGDEASTGPAAAAAA